MSGADDADTIARLQKELEEQRDDNRHLRGRNLQLKEHNSMLSQRLSKFQRVARYLEEIFEQKVREMEAKVRERENKMEQLRDVLSKAKVAELPKGTFVMDEWKRMYSNEDTIPTALPYFWKNFDPSNYSVWYCEYKFAEELTLVFMSCHLISGMFQRLERMRKYAFGSMILFGADNDSTISGVWIWRGHDLAFLSLDCKIDYEWSKLDAKAPETKTLIDEYFAWEGGFGGKKFNQGKIFK